MMISVPYLPDGATARAVVTVEVTTHPDPAAREDRRPEDPREARRRNSAMYINGSPYIEVKHQRDPRAEQGDHRRASTSPPPIGRRSKRSTTSVLEEVEYVEGTGQERGRNAPRRPGRLPGPQHGVHRAVPGEQDPGPHGVGRRPRLCRVLSGERRRARATGTRSNRPARGRSARCRSPGRSCRRATTSACPSGKSGSATRRTICIGLPTPGGGKPKVKYIREPCRERSRRVEGRESDRGRDVGAEY